MRCVVTGGCGFIGGHLVDALVKEGHEVHVLDDYSTGVYRRTGVYYYDVDISQLNLVADAWPSQVDAVFHLAAVSRTVPAINDPLRCLQVNVMGTANLLQTAWHRDVASFINSSSNVVLAGDTAYKASKQAGEVLVETWARLYKFSAMSLRYANVYGPRIPKGDLAVFASLRDHFQAHGHALVTGDGSQTRDFIHVSDVVRANLIAWKHMATPVDELPTKGMYNLRGCTLDICTGRQTSINDALTMLDISARRYDMSRPGDVRSIVQSPDQALMFMGFAPKVKLEDGIKDIWTY